MPQCCTCQLLFFYYAYPTFFCVWYYKPGIFGGKKSRPAVQYIKMCDLFLFHSPQFNLKCQIAK